MAITLIPYKKTSIFAALAIASLALSGCATATAPADFKADPALKKATPLQLRAKIAKACTLTEAQRTNTWSRYKVKPCDCYATAFYKDLSEDEVSFYRENGYFNASAIPKGKAALAACGIER